MPFCAELCLQGLCRRRDVAGAFASPLAGKWSGEESLLFCQKDSILPQALSLWSGWRSGLFVGLLGFHSVSGLLAPTHY